MEFKLKLKYNQDIKKTIEYNNLMLDFIRFTSNDIMITNIKYNPDTLDEDNIVSIKSQISQKLYQYLSVFRDIKKNEAYIDLSTLYVKIYLLSGIHVQVKDIANFNDISTETNATLIYEGVLK
jgi:hypothetical protein